MDGVRAGSRDDAVITAAAIDRVRARTAVDPFHTRAPNNRVVAAVEAVITSAAADTVIGSAAPQRVVSVGAAAHRRLSSVWLG